MRALALAAALALAFAPAAAQGSRRTTLEALSAALEADPALGAAERAALREALSTRFADYGLQGATPAREPAVRAALRMVVEGTFDEASPERVADVAFAAYQAIGRGAPADVVEGIALYGYRKKVSGETIAVWANGYQEAVRGGVPPEVAADLVRNALENGWEDSTFNILKWALVQAAKDGFDRKDYATYLFGKMAQGAKPGALTAEARAAFKKAKASGKKPDLPAYAGVFSRNVFTPPLVEAAPEAVVDVPPATHEERARKTPPEKSRTARVGSAKRTSTLTPASPATGAEPEKVSVKMEQLWPGLDETSRSYLGTPYVWGGTTRRGVDCSGLTQNTYGENRVKIPRVSRDQWKTGETVTSLKRGDLVFFNTMGVGVSHVGMVVDPAGPKFIHASSSKGVMVADLSGRYFKQRYLGARRIVP